MDARVVKKAECRRIDAFKLSCWRRLLRVPWNVRRSNQVRLKGNQSWIFIGIWMKLKLQYFGHLRQRTDSLEKTLMLEKIEGRRRRDSKGWDGWMASPTRWTWVWVMGVGDGQGSLGCCSPWGHKKLDVTKWLNWIWIRLSFLFLRGSHEQRLF